MEVEMLIYCLRRGAREEAHLEEIELADRDAQWRRKKQLAPPRAQLALSPPVAPACRQLERRRQEPPEADRLEVLRLINARSFLLDAALFASLTFNLFADRKRIERRFDVMISYSRADGLEYALSAKAALEEEALSVYLDLAEIRLGCDWQDSLNEAVRGCRLLLALVTPTYGFTEWTRRELKLADVLRKRIVPVNFGCCWPPEPLAIQLATRQYVFWLPEAAAGECPILRHFRSGCEWPFECAVAVARQVSAALTSGQLAESDQSGASSSSSSSSSFEAQKVQPGASELKAKRLSFVWSKVKLRRKGPSESDKCNDEIEQANGLKAANDGKKWRLAKKLRRMIKGLD